MSIVAYAPDDLTVSVTTDTTLGELQAHLAPRGQWLPVDPPQPERLTIKQILDFNLSGPRRFGHGTIREHLLGIRAQLPDGRTIRNGGAVVKNAAGYDLCRLLTGARGELGAILEATFKVAPQPESERFLEARFASLQAAAEFVDKVDGSALLPVVLDLHRLSPDAEWTMVAGFAGDCETVDWQCTEVQRFGKLEVSSLEHENRFWVDGMADAAVRKLSVLPSKLAETIEGLGAGVTSLVARAGSGVLYYRGGPVPPQAQPTPLMQRLQEAFQGQP